MGLSLNNPIFGKKKKTTLNPPQKSQDKHKFQWEKSK